MSGLPSTLCRRAVPIAAAVALALVAGACDPDGASTDVEARKAAATTAPGTRPSGDNGDGNDGNNDRETADGPDIEVEARFPGLWVTAGNRIVDLSAKDNYVVATGPAGVGGFVRPPLVAGDRIVAATGDEPDRATLWVIELSPSTNPPRRIAEGVAGFAVSDDGGRVAWSNPGSDGRSAALVEADIATGQHRHDLDVDRFARVVGYAGNRVVLSTGDGAEAAAATWQPGAPTIVPVAAPAQVGRYGTAIDAGDGRALVTAGDGVCVEEVAIDTPTPEPRRKVAPCSDRNRPLGAVSLFLRGELAYVERGEVHLTETDSLHGWKVDGDVVDIRPVSPNELVVVTDDHAVLSCDRTATRCEPLATVDGGNVWIVRGAPATVNPQYEPASLRITPATARAGDEVTVAADRVPYCAFAELVVSISPESGLPEVPVIGKATTDRAGRFETRVRIPADTQPGVYILDASDASSPTADAFPCSHRNAGGRVTVTSR